MRSPSIPQPCEKPPICYSSLKPVDHQPPGADLTARAWHAEMETFLTRSRQAMTSMRARKPATVSAEQLTSPDPWEEEMNHLPVTTLRNRALTFAVTVSALLLV